ncbi:MAG: Hsp20/alpha crystallin family protein [Candidatus Aenigmatarchaeota archaeon]|nr:MAG: Hsp20/alpha crystallin family protein [Candidatus Aenigmarchaeota archaeon]
MAKKKKRDFTFFWEEPLEDMRSFQREIDKRMRSFFDFSEPLTFQFSVPKFFKGIRFGKTDDEIIVVAELPGFSKEDVNIEVTEDSVHITAEKKSKKHEEGFFESSSSRVDRKFSLPEKIIPEKATAKMKNGILEIKLPRAIPEKKARQLKID